MAGAYAALLSLARSLHQILNLEHSLDPLHKGKIVSLYEKVDSIVTFLGEHGGTLDLVGNGIRQAAYEAQDLMDSFLYLVSRTDEDCDEEILDQDLNRAFKRVDFIWKETMKMKNNDPVQDPRSTTYSSLLSLARTLHQILNLDRYDDPLDKEIVVSLHERVNFIVKKHFGTVDRVGNRIREAAHEAQDFMDSYLCSVSTANVDSSSSVRRCMKFLIKLCNGAEVSVDQDLNMALERINFIWNEVMIDNMDAVEDLQPITYSSLVDRSFPVKITTTDMAVGLDDLNAIKERLYEDSTKLQIIPIVGMGGIGKTTLAQRAYKDSLLGGHFDICAWITLSAEYQRREILSRLLQSFKKPANDLDEQFNESEPRLATLVYQNLMDRRYLIVIDDIWSTKAWDDLKMIFPDNGNGSRILLTTRLLNVAVLAGSSTTPIHKMDFLDEAQSWKLLQARIFGQESCPDQLMEIGKKIARKCGGLPLTIVVVAGLILSTGNIMKPELWEDISENISSTEPTIESQCSRILCLSYDRLPLRLKLCFLYMTAFPEDYEINVSKLIMLWVAEGFIKPSDQSKSLEDVGEQYLEDLVNRSLILVNKKEPEGKLKTVGVHDILRNICIAKAEEEGFLHHVSSKRNYQIEFIENCNRRLRIHSSHDFLSWEIVDSSIRSVLLLSKKYSVPTLSLSCELLNILDAPKVSWLNLSDEISVFHNLRYIAFPLNYASCPTGFPASLSKLPNLQTIIAHATEFGSSYIFQVPYEVWGMPKLRHLIMNSPFLLSYPSNIGTVRESDLQTLEPVRDFRFIEEVIKVLVKLKKLKVHYLMSHYNCNDFDLHNLFRLRNLEQLEISMLCLHNYSTMWNYAFPISLKKLTLHGVPLPWENMTIIGSLPNLQVLEMSKICAAEGSTWTPMEGQFLQLLYFHSSLDNLVRWEVEKEHFPCLESLILKGVRWIDEIPCGIEEIDSLQLIELWFCTESLVDSAKRIEEQKHEDGNDAFQVLVNYSDDIRKTKF